MDKVIKSFTQPLIILNNQTSLKVKITGNSMFPILSDGDLVFINKSENIKSGDIVLVILENGQKIIHRAFFVGKKLLTMGDANINFDNFVIKTVVGVADINESFFRRFYFLIKMFIRYQKRCLFGK